MRPTKNRVYCYGCQRSKMLFESKTKADNFIAYNSEGILEENGKAPVRSYYCELCKGYHVTSNPSLEAGESLNQRDQKIVELINNYKKGTDDYNQIHLVVSNKLSYAKRQMYLGDFKCIEQLYEDFQFDQDYLLKLPLKIRSKYVLLHQKVEILKEVAEQMDELLQLPKEEIEEKLSVESPSKKEKKLSTMVRGYFLIQEYKKRIESISLLIDEEKWEEARSLLVQLQVQMSEKKWIGIMKEYIESFKEELGKYEKAIARRKKVTKKDETASKVCVDTDVKATYNSEEYKSSILSVIKRIEKVKQAFEQNDLDTCENELEIAEFLMDDFSFEDDNTKLLRSQIEMWKKKIAEGN